MQKNKWQHITWERSNVGLSKKKVLGLPKESVVLDFKGTKENKTFYDTDGINFSKPNSMCRTIDRTDPSC